MKGRRNNISTSRVSQSVLIQRIKTLSGGVFCWWNKRSGWMRFIVTYTLLFVFVSTVIFWGYFTDGNTFIHQGSDSIRQHFRALQYVGVYIRNCVSSVISGDWSLPLWDFNIGMGGDVLTTLHYYGLTDPTSWLSAFVPSKYTYILYGFLVVAKMYLAGLSFAFMCKALGVRRCTSILIGAISYTFCAWSIVYGTWQIMFELPMIYLPLIVTGTYRVLQNKSGIALTVSVFLLSISNIYFMGICAILDASFVILWLVLSYKKEMHRYIKPLLKIFAYSLAGVSLAAVVLLPVGYAMFSGGRLDSGVVDSTLWPWSYYSNLPAAFVSVENFDGNLILAMSPIAVLSVGCLFLTKGHSLLKAMVMGALTILLLPLLAKAINGFLYADNRWAFALPLIFSYILVIKWQDMRDADTVGIRRMALAVAGYATLCFLFDRSRLESTLAAVVVALVFVLFLAITRGSDYIARIMRESSMVVISLLGVIVLGCYINGFSEGAFAYKTLSSEDMRYIKNDDARAVKKLNSRDIKRNEFYRYSGRSVTTNSGFTNSVPSTSYYWSTANPYMHEFYSKLGLRDNHTHWYDELDDRSTLLSLASVKYYTIPVSDNGPVPNGFKYLKTTTANSTEAKSLRASLSKWYGSVNLEQQKYINKSISNRYKIYENKYVLPMGYTYKDTISTCEWQMADIVGREQLMRKYLVLNNSQSCSRHTNKGKQNTKEHNLSYAIKYGRTSKATGITVKDHKIIVTDAGATVRLIVKNNQPGNMFVQLSGLRYDSTSPKQLYSDDTSVDPNNLYNLNRLNREKQYNKIGVMHSARFWKPIEKTTIRLSTDSHKGFYRTILYRTPTYNWYANRHDFAINMGANNGHDDVITLSFSDPGVYSFDSLDVTVQSNKDYAKDMERLAAESLKGIKITGNSVEGNIKVGTCKWLALSIPYSEGWMAYVDGKEVNLRRANIMYMALRLSPGEHRVKLIYRTPLLQEGAIISSSTVIVLAIFLCVRTITRRHVMN